MYDKINDYVLAIRRAASEIREVACDSSGTLKTTPTPTPAQVRQSLKRTADALDDIAEFIWHHHPDTHETND